MALGMGLALPLMPTLVCTPPPEPATQAGSTTSLPDALHPLTQYETGIADVVEVGTASASETRRSETPADASFVLSASVPALSPRVGAPITFEDAWIGMTPAEVRESLKGSARARVQLTGTPVLTIRGDTWLVEWEPGGCSDWTQLLTLRFSGGRVVKANEKPRHHYTGKECGFEHQ